MKIPELLAPAGTLAMLDTAFAFGADAVYAGQPRYSLRVRNNDFGDLGVLAEGMRRAKARGKEFYLVANIFPHGAKLKTFLDDMAPAVALAPDAVIMSDPGLMMLVREAWPELPIHLSVQANTVNAASVKFWARNGVTRVILSREISLDEVEAIRQACPETELEVFIHGALCIAYSGRCLLSGYFNRRDPNQGSCTNSCRWEYRVGQASSTCGEAVSNFQKNWRNATGPSQGVAAPSGGVSVASRGASAFAAGPSQGVAAPSGGESVASRGASPAAPEILIEEKERPGEFMPIEEDEHGTYLLNSKDLRAIEHVRRLMEIGVDSLKIEGRTKSPYYVARTVQAYRQAINDAAAGRPLDPLLLASLEGLANRGYTDGFYQRHHDADYQNYLRGHSESARSLYVGHVVAWDAVRRRVEVEVRNRFSEGDRVELVQPAGNREFVIDGMQDAAGGPVAVAPGDGHRVWMEWPEDTVGAFVARFL